MVGSSSRGPSNYYQQIKPEIGAPGASVSAIAGSGARRPARSAAPREPPRWWRAPPRWSSTASATNQRGSSGAGKAERASPSAPDETKALLMNNAETDIDIDPFLGLAEITRIGGGEVRPDRAIAAPTAAWDNGAPQAALSFGMHEVAQTVTLTKTVRIRNFSNERHTYTITPTFRFTGDVTGAVTPSAPASVRVNPGLGRDATFDISLTIDPSLLPGNSMNSGSNGANGAALSANEFDGYLVLDNGKGHVINLPWHVLPRKAAETVADSDTFPAGERDGRPDEHRCRHRPARRLRPAGREPGDPERPDGWPEPGARHQVGGHQHLPGPGRVLLRRTRRSSGSSPSTPGRTSRTCCR
jgi:minor extracellular serine protease Vpr